VSEYVHRQFDDKDRCSIGVFPNPDGSVRIAAAGPHVGPWDVMVDIPASEAPALCRAIMEAATGVGFENAGKQPEHHPFSDENNGLTQDLSQQRTASDLAGDAQTWAKFLRIYHRKRKVYELLPDSAEAIAELLELCAGLLTEAKEPVQMTMNATQALEWVKGEIVSLCEATEDDPILINARADTERYPQGYARGRMEEAKLIRRVMADVIGIKIREIREGETPEPKGKLEVAVEALERIADELGTASPRSVLVATETARSALAAIRGGE
jgi:hypothetical protein